MSTHTSGLHHVTAISSDAQQNLNFYGGLLGLRLVKQTVNFDDPTTYHFYYGDEAGSPGSILTFFPIRGAYPGRPGTGETAVTSFAVPPAALSYWVERLRSAGVTSEGPITRFNEQVVGFSDPDGLRLELVAHPRVEGLPGWAGGPVPAQHALRGVYHVALSLQRLEATAELLTGSFGFQLVGQEGNRHRYAVGAGGPGQVIDLLHQPELARAHTGAGSVHHIAWRATNGSEQRFLQQELVNLGYRVTPVQDRNYFESIYFREPGGILFEVATDPPGFAVDEPLEALGTKLMLPPWLEQHRAELLRQLPSLQLPGAER